MTCGISANIRPVTGWVSGACVAALCVACSAVQRDSAPALTDLPAPGSEQIQTEIELELAADKTLAIANPYGDIHVRQSGGPALHLNLFLQRTEHSGTQARIAENISATRQDLTVTAEPGASRNEVLRIDLVVFVPRQPRLMLTSQHGMIEVKKLGNPLIEASSDSGELRLTSSSVMHARSKTGRIRATIMQPGWSGESRISSESGLVQVFLPLSPNLHLLANTGASIRSEFTLDIKQHGKGSRAELNNGDGSDELVVTNRNGEIQLYSVVIDPAASLTVPEDDD